MRNRSAPVGPRALDEGRPIDALAPLGARRASVEPPTKASRHVPDRITTTAGPAASPTRVSRRKVVLTAAAVGFVILAGVVVYLYVQTFVVASGRNALTTEPAFSGLDRVVTGNTLVSARDPAVEMSFSDEYQYLGGQRFGLYGVADVEQHFFVEEHADGSLKSLFWLQFEQFKADNTFTYDYTSSQLAMDIDVLDFAVDAEPGTRAPRLFWRGEPGSDGHLARSFLDDEGYVYPDDYFYARLAHVPDPDRRKELLVFYIDDLAPTGMTGEELRDDEDSWREVEASYLRDLEQVLEISPA